LRAIRVWHFLLPDVAGTGSAIIAVWAGQDVVTGRDWLDFGGV